MKKLWERWGQLTNRLLASVGSQTSLLALVLVFAPQPIKVEGWLGLVLALALALAITSVYLEVTSDLREHLHRKTYRRDDAVGIKQYMHRWIGGSGKAAIWTRDLSWVDDDQTRDLLAAKAKGGNLILCMPKMNEMGAKLQAAGADVRIYGRDGFDSPASRFTIAFVGNGGSRVAVGRGKNGMHIIEELDADHPALHMAKDLIELARLLAKLGGASA